MTELPVLVDRQLAALGNFFSELNTSASGHFSSLRETLYLNIYIFHSLLFLQLPISLYYFIMSQFY